MPWKRTSFLENRFLFYSLKLTDERFLVLRVNPITHSEQTCHPSLPFWIGTTSIQARLDFPLQVVPLAARVRCSRRCAGCRWWLQFAPLAARAAGCLGLPCRFAWLAPLAALQPPLQLRFMHLTISYKLTTSWNQIAERQTQTDYIRILTKVTVLSTG